MLHRSHVACILDCASDEGQILRQILQNCDLEMSSQWIQTTILVSMTLLNQKPKTLSQR